MGQRFTSPWVALKRKLYTDLYLLFFFHFNKVASRFNLSSDNVFLSEMCRKVLQPAGPKCFEAFSVKPEKHFRLVKTPASHHIMRDLQTFIFLPSHPYLKPPPPSPSARSSCFVFCCDQTPVAPCRPARPQRKAGRANFSVFAWVVSNRCIFNLMLRVTWLSFNGNSLVRRMRLNSLMWTLWFFFFY